jgi:tetratricopeptide (TPR) repeat protein
MRVLGREWPALYIILGRAAYERGAPGEARDYFERAATLQPGNLRAQEALLRLDLRLEDYERAAQRVRRILAVHPEHPEGNLAHARILRENKQYAEAEAVVRDMLERGRDPRALAELAWLAQERGDGESALAAADEALRLNSRLAEAWAAKGRVLVSMGQPDAGRAALEQAVQFDPRPFAPRFLLAEALFADGEFEKSRELAGSLIQERGRALTPEQRKSLRALAGPR